MVLLILHMYVLSAFFLSDGFISNGIVLCISKFIAYL